MNEGPEITARISEVTICRGETLTVYLDSRDYNEQRDVRQVELRVLSDGTREVFLRGESDGVNLTSFDDWYGPDTPALLTSALAEIEKLKTELGCSRNDVADEVAAKWVAIDKRDCLKRSLDSAEAKATCLTCKDGGVLTYIGTPAGSAAAWQEMQDWRKKLNDDPGLSVPGDECLRIIKYFLAPE